MILRRIAAIGVALCASLDQPVSAQIDYRNLDAERPTATEDAYPIEHYAFELVGLYRFESGADGTRLHVVVPEVAYGVLANTEIGIQVPVAGLDSGSQTDWGWAGLRTFGLYNFNTEGPILPALTLRGDVAFPLGSLAGEGTRITIRGIATRSWARLRFHLNVARSLGSEDALAAAEPVQRWAYSVAADRTLFRQSLLLVGEVAASQAVRGAPTAVNASLGARYQWTPTSVLHAGVTRRLGNDLGPNFGFTFGLSHAFALRTLMPAADRLRSKRCYTGSC